MTYTIKMILCLIFAQIENTQPCYAVCYFMSKTTHQSNASEQIIRSQFTGWHV